MGIYLTFIVLRCYIIFLVKINIAQPKEALAMLPPYQTGRLDNSPKMVVTMEILDRSVQLGDKLLIFR